MKKIKGFLVSSFGINSIICFLMLCLGFIIDNRMNNSGYESAVYFNEGYWDDTLNEVGIVFSFSTFFYTC
ncbi:hypothetical protein BCR23_13115 [Enterococcus quebecensis]|uniref:Uncharacterized protein n=1 Tax=Enterococcus quebecensis TaxID=903983 RepID=A0A1E5H1W4_9ENTE|nr:hypothetical protein BCR23_13115 [Enterococcus quebecensis]